MGKNWVYHLVAFVTVAIWGSTFVFTKMLLHAGLSPAQIFHHAQGVLLWSADHYTLLYSAPIGVLDIHPRRFPVLQSFPPPQPALSGCRRLHALLPGMELGHPPVGCRRSHQLGLLQPHHHHCLRLVAPSRANHPLVLAGLPAHPHGNVPL